MSQRERAKLVVPYWLNVGGTLIEEFLAVRRNKCQGYRRIDGIIVFDGKRRCIQNKDYNSAEIADKEIIVVQAKLGRVGMYLLGQALFSRELMRRFRPKSIRTVAVCERGDAVLAPIAAEYGIEIVIYGAEECDLQAQPTLHS